MRSVRWATTAALSIAVTIGQGCYQRGARVAPAPIPLRVQNMGFFDVAVYAVPTSASNRVRIGTVTGNSNARLTVPYNAVRPGGVLVLYLHAIGSQRSWVSPAVSVGEGTVATLDIHADRDGNLSRSMFYTTPGETAPAELVPAR